MWVTAVGDKFKMLVTVSFGRQHSLSLIIFRHDNAKDVPIITLVLVYREAQCGIDNAIRAFSTKKSFLLQNRDYHMFSTEKMIK